MTIHDLGIRRVGLVLSGGGAKGAYHIGCLKALRARGLDRFEAIAGSSVGAINAVCLGAGRLDDAERAWRNLRACDVVGLNLKSILRLPAWLLAALGSEFSPFKITRLSDRNGWHACVHVAVCAALAGAFWLARGLMPAEFAQWSAIVAMLPLALAALTLVQRFTRPIFLRPVATTNAPLARMLDELLSQDDVER
ncbi:MAG TPA: patatin-like phospholipase family protein, partial [Vicinamibacterales bacterium]|nr:patatin-like phospholipase family protein [Vicinamibacterales bacterium]